jgi:hypothetical protein
MLALFVSTYVIAGLIVAAVTVGLVGAEPKFGFIGSIGVLWLPFLWGALPAALGYQIGSSRRTPQSWRVAAAGVASAISVSVVLELLKRTPLELGPIIGITAVALIACGVAAARFSIPRDSRTVV